MKIQIFLNIFGAMIAIGFLALGLLSFHYSHKITIDSPEMAIDLNEKGFFESDQNPRKSANALIHSNVDTLNLKLSTEQNPIFSNIYARDYSMELSKIDRNDQLISTRRPICPPNYSLSTNYKFCFLVGKLRTQWGELMPFAGNIFLLFSHKIGNEFIPNGTSRTVPYGPYDTISSEL